VRIVFFDLATRSGWAAGDDGGVEDFGDFEMPRTGMQVGEYLCVAERHIDQVVCRFRPDMVAFEAPFLNRRTDTILKLRKLGGLANIAEMIAFRRGREWGHASGLDCREAMVDDVRRHFLGREYPRTRQQAKIATKVRCRDLGWDVDNDDEADALAGLSYMHAIMDPARALDVAPLFRWKPKPRSRKRRPT